MRVRFRGDVWFWRGPSPFHFVSVPASASHDIHEIAAFVTYGWGVIPCSVTLGKTTWTTSLIPKDGLYLVPIKAAIRQAEGIDIGATVDVTVVIGETPQT